MKQVKVSFLLLCVFIFVQTSIADNGVHTDNIVIILDASGSMQDKFRADETRSKMDAAKEALKEVLAKVPDGTNIGLLVFSGRNIRDEWVYPLGPKDTARIIAAIDLPQPEGGTPLGRYMRIGANRLLEQREKQYNYGNYRLLIVTDGEAQDQAKIEQYTPEILNRQIRVDVIGVDMKTDHKLATDADSYRRADNPGELVAAVSQILAETGGTGTDIDGEDAFEYIAPLSSEVALDLIQRITTPPSNTAIETTTVKHMPSQPKTPTPQQPIQQPVQKRSGGNSGWLIIGLVIVIVGFIVFRRMGR
ncbi:MAG: VWA domain-containing protein [Candidatus Poribacteria bacterium]|nr:VWA domain-containing protein [Candidatus Poribacteria bacterium]